MKTWQLIPLGVALACGSLSLAAADLVPVPDFGLRVERGFAITEFADNNLAPDTWCMTIDSRGRVVVANGKSIRVLIDEDGDEHTNGFAIRDDHAAADRKSTRLNSSHMSISYAVFCLKKKKKNTDRLSIL